MTIEEIAQAVAAEWKMSFGGIELDFALEVARRAAVSEREACADCVPNNWCDSMLTGPDSVIGKVSDCRPIEAVLNATRARIMERSNASFSRGPSGPSAGSES